MTANSRKVLVPLAGLLAAGTVAIGSGATWTSTTSSSVSVTSGDLIHTNSHENAVLTIDDMKPGDTATGTVAITNTGSIDSKLTFQESGDTSGFSAGALTLVIKQDGSTIYTGDFGGYTTGAQDVGDLDAGDASTFTFTVTLAANASNSDQNKAAAATYTWVTTQKDAGSTLLENWV
jgi:spore coat-associated protein N